MSRKPKWIGEDVSRLLGGSALIFSSRIAGAVLAFVTQLLLARWMGAAEFGSYVFAYSWLLILATLPVGGYGAAAVRFIGQGLAHEDHGYVRGFIRHSVRVTLVSSIGIALLGFLVISLNSAVSPEILVLFIATFIGVPFFALISFDSGIALASSRFVLGFIPGQIVRPLLFLVAASMALLSQMRLDAAAVMAIHVAAMIAVAIPTTIVTRLSTKRLLSPAPPTFETKIWNSNAFSLLVMVLFTNYFQQITVVISGFFLPSADIAVYHVSFRIAALITFVLYAIDTFVAPKLSLHYHNEERAELVRATQQSTTLRFLTSLAAVVFLVLFGDWVLSLFGEEFVSGHVMLVILALAQLSSAAVGPVARVLGIAGHHKECLYASVGAVVLWLLLTAALMPIYGVLGVVIAVFISLTAWAFVLRHVALRFLGIDMLILVRDVGNPSDKTENE